MEFINRNKDDKTEEIKDINIIKNDGMKKLSPEELESVSGGERGWKMVKPTKA